MTTFIESPRFPDDMAYFASGGPQFNTSVIQLNSGYEQRNTNWNQSRAIYNFGNAVRTQDYLLFPIRETISFFRAMKGKSFGFRFKDFQDFKVNIAEGIVGNGTGDYKPQNNIQLNKKYITGTLIDIKNIKKPVDGTVKIYKNGILQTLATNYTINYTSGLVTFLPNSFKTISSISIGVNPAVVTTSTNHLFNSGDVIYFNITNGNAIDLNFYTITVTSPTTFTIPVSNLTAATGIAYLYNTPSDLLTWEGEFDIPVRFDTDNLNYNVGDGGLVDISNLSIVEIRV